MRLRGCSRTLTEKYSQKEDFQITLLRCFSRRFGGGGLAGETSDEEVAGDEWRLLLEELEAVT